MKKSLDSFISTIEKLISLVSKGTFVIAMIALLLMMLVTAYSVIMRYVLRNPVLGTLEFIETMMVIVIFFGIPWVTLKKEQMSLSAIVSKLDPIIQKIFAALTQMLGIVMFTLIAWRQTTEAKYSLILLERSDLLRIPRYPLYYIIAFGVGMLALIFFVNLIRIFLPKKEVVSEQ